MKALTVRRTGRGEAQSVIRDVDGRSGPAERAGGRAQGVVQTQAFLVAPHLMGGGWPDVHEGLAGQRVGGEGARRGASLTSWKSAVRSAWRRVGNPGGGRCQ